MTTLTIFASEDTFVDSDSPGSNFGTQSNMGWWHDGATERNIAFAKFSMASVPSTITAATFNLYKNGGSGDAGTHNIDRVTGADWTEGGLTYTNKPATTGYTTMANIATGTGAFAPVDVKTLVENWKSGAWSNFGLAIRKGSLFGSFDSRTRESADDPYLSVTYNAAPSAPGAWTNPTGGIVAGTITAAHGTATDPEGTTPTYENDFWNGSAWVAMAGGTSFSFNSTSYADGTGYQFRTRASDGVNFSGYTTSSTFTIQNATARPRTIIG